MLRRYTAIGLLLALVLTGLACAKPVKVPMSDGVRLAADVYLPTCAGKGPWPVVLERTPYNRKNSALILYQFVKEGYVVMVQNLRGTRDSEGAWEVFGHDGWGGPGRQDGLDTIEWIKQQPWCNGKIGLAGFSASGIAAQLLLAAEPEGVACAFIGAASDNFYESIFPNGCYRVNTIEEWDPARAMLPVFEQHPAYDDFWESRNARARANRVNVPVYILSGWFDLFQRSATAFFEEVNNNGLPQTQGQCKLVINTLAHAAPPGTLEFPDRCGINPDTAIGSIQDWFDYWLKGKQNGILDKPDAALFVMTDAAAPNANGNAWMLTDNWPPPAEPLHFYLHAGGALLPEMPLAAEAATRYIYDPADPTPALGGNNLTPPSGPHDQRAIEARPDVITFETAPLEEELTIIGPITVTLFVSSSALDTDFGARLCDVYPDGRSMLMNEGMLRMRYREDITSESLLDPGEVYEITLDLWDTALCFAQGHRIRLAIMSCSDPRYDPNPNTGEPFRQHTHTVTAENTIYHDAARPSRLTLPAAAWRRQ